MKSLLVLMFLSSQSCSLNTQSTTMNITEALLTILHNYRDEIHCLPAWYRNEWTHQSFQHVLKENKETPQNFTYDFTFCSESSHDNTNFNDVSFVNETLHKVASKVGIDSSRFSDKSIRQEKSNFTLRIQVDGKVSPFSLLKLCRLNSNDLELRSESGRTRLCQIKPVENHHEKHDFQITPAELLLTTIGVGVILLCVLICIWLFVQLFFNRRNFRRLNVDWDDLEEELIKEHNEREMEIFTIQDADNIKMITPTFE